MVEPDRQATPPNGRTPFMSNPTYETVAGRTYANVSRADAAVDATTTGWVGWGIFAAVMMIIGGSLNLFYGIVAAVNDDWVVWTNRGSLYLDLSTWGWVHIVV